MEDNQDKSTTTSTTSTSSTTSSSPNNPNTVNNNNSRSTTTEEREKKRERVNNNLQKKEKNNNNNNRTKKVTESTTTTSTSTTTTSTSPSSYKTEMDPTTLEVFVYQNLNHDNNNSSSSSTSTTSHNHRNTKKKDNGGLTWQQEAMLNTSTTSTSSSSRLNPNAPSYQPKLNHHKLNNNNNNNNNTSNANASTSEISNSSSPTSTSTTTTSTTTTTTRGERGGRSGRGDRGGRKPPPSQTSSPLSSSSSPMTSNSNQKKPSSPSNAPKEDKRKQQSKQQQKSTTANNSSNNSTPSKINSTLQRKANESKLKFKFEENKNEDYTPLAIQIIGKLEKGAYECMVCYDNIKHSAMVWNCPSCFTMFHIGCIKAWLTKSTSTDGKWKCPGCRHVLSERPHSVCFCGKQDDPPFNPYLLPHSCGDVCGKLRAKSKCPHKCTLLCHPGPCLPCSALGEEKDCHCGRTKYRLLCGEPDPDGRSCGAICERPLSCGNHTCQDKCHKGQCAPCQVKEQQVCYCGKQKDVARPCGSGKFDEITQGSFPCIEQCNRLLACGKHHCQRSCHAGACDECELLPSKITTCSCTQTPLSELGVVRPDCSAPLATCSKVCNKTLVCGVHQCPEKCHTGACPPCKIRVKTTCRCGSSKENRQCGVIQANLASPDIQAPFLCGSKCRAMKSCGKHECGRKCCPSTSNSDALGLHICTLVCGRPLKCGVHRCEQLCHTGKCYPCMSNSYEEMSCRCGKTVILPPIPCGSRGPVCTHPCRERRECGHENEEMAQHPCHFGSCPPCPVLVEKMCSGGHELRKNIKCHTIDVSCGKPCGKTLPCLVHKCPRTCHLGPCLVNKVVTEDDILNGISCGYACEQPLSTCQHGCQAPCHPGEPCPPQVCKQKTKIYCPCGRRCVETVCIPKGSDSRELECDEVCEKEKRDKLFLSLKTENEPVPVEDITSTNLKIDNLNLMFKAAPRSIKRIENLLNDFINSNNLKLSIVYNGNTHYYFLVQMSRFYNLKLRDRRNQNILELYKSRASIIPSPLLSEQNSFAMLSSVSKNTQSYASASLNSAIVEEQLQESRSLYFYNLNPSIKNDHINQLLQEFNGRYQLLWIDDSNCLAIFDDLSHFTQASTIKTTLLPFIVFKDDPSKIEVTTSSSQPPLPSPIQFKSPSYISDFFLTNRFSYLDPNNNNNNNQIPQQKKIEKRIDTNTSTTSTTSSINNYGGEKEGEQGERLKEEGLGKIDDMDHDKGVRQITSSIEHILSPITNSNNNNNQSNNNNNSNNSSPQIDDWDN